MMRTHVRMIEGYSGIIIQSHNTPRNTRCPFLTITTRNTLVRQLGWEFTQKAHIIT
jgi:hypothetical protein